MVIQMQIPKIVILPSLPLNMLPLDRFRAYTMYVVLRHLNEFKSLMEYIKEVGAYTDVDIYIRHKPTIDALVPMLVEMGYNVRLIDGEYKYSHYDKIIVVTLSKRAPKGEDVQVKPDELLIFDLIISPLH